MASSTMSAAVSRLPGAFLGSCQNAQERSSHNVETLLASSQLHTGFTSTQSLNTARRYNQRQHNAVKTISAEAGEPVTRRQAVQTILLTSVSALVPALTEAQASIAASDDPRQQLLDAIKAKSKVQEAIDRIAEVNPTPKPNKSDKVDGRWKLLWSSDVAEVSKVTRFLPIGAESFQLIGPGGGVGKGRAQNIVSVAGGAVQLKLTSSCVPDEKNDSDFVVGPPFKLELFLGSKALPLSEVKDTNSDRTPILGNELNYFEQVYLEDSGKPGDLRVSRVLTGDDRVVGSIFVHERL